jgi:hypothetical protein
VANHNKDGPKTKVKMKTFLTALSSVLYFMFYFPPYVLYGKPSVHIEKWTDHHNRGWQIYFVEEERDLD